MFCATQAEHVGKRKERKNEEEEKKEIEKTVPVTLWIVTCTGFYTLPFSKWKNREKKDAFEIHLRTLPYFFIVPQFLFLSINFKYFWMLRNRFLIPSRFFQVTMWTAGWRFSRARVPGLVPLQESYHSALPWPWWLGLTTSKVSDDYRNVVTSISDVHRTTFAVGTFVTVALFTVVVSPLIHSVRFALAVEKGSRLNFEGRLIDGFTAWKKRPSCMRTSLFYRFDKYISNQKDRWGAKWLNGSLLRSYKRLASFLALVPFDKKNNLPAIWKILDIWKGDGNCSWLATIRAPLALLVTLVKISISTNSIYYVLSIAICNSPFGRLCEERKEIGEKEKEVEIPKSLS